MSNPYFPTPAPKRAKSPGRQSLALVIAEDQLPLFDDPPQRPRVTTPGAIVNDLGDLVAIRTASGGLRFNHVISH